MKYISIIIEDNYDDIMIYLEVKGCKWSSGDLPTEYQSPSGAKFITINGNKDLCFNCGVPKYKTMTLDGFKSHYPITLEDLKPGMVIEYADSRRRMIGIIDNKLTFFDDRCWLDANNKYSVNLEYREDSQLNINKVFVTTPASLNTMLNNAVCIWERPQILEVTMDEIAKKFGIPVSQLKIKK